MCVCVCVCVRVCACMFTDICFDSFLFFAVFSNLENWHLKEYIIIMKITKQEQQENGQINNKRERVQGDRRDRTLYSRILLLRM